MRSIILLIIIIVGFFLVITEKKKKKRHSNSVKLTGEQIFIGIVILIMVTADCLDIYFYDKFLKENFPSWNFLERHTYGIPYSLYFDYLKNFPGNLLTVLSIAPLLLLLVMFIIKYWFSKIELRKEMRKYKV